MMGTYPLLHAQYTTAKREIQEVFSKNANKPACIKRRRQYRSENLKIQRPRPVAGGNGGSGGGGTTNRKA